MDLCRICLAKAGERDIFQLSEELKGDKKQYWEIVLFCLNIKVLPASKLTTKLCDKCFIKIIAFHEFKTLALETDQYLHSLLDKNHYNETVIKCDTFEMDIIKCEEVSNAQSDDALCEMGFDNIEYGIKNEQDIDSVPSDDELLSVIKKIKYEYISGEYKENKETPAKKKGKKAKIRKKNKEPESREKICEECGKTVINLIDHMKLHRPAAERKKIKCKVCDKMFSSYGARYRHNKVKHLGIKQHCKECGKDVVSLRSHTLLMHNSENLRHECVPCGRRFISQSTRDFHMRKHTKDRPFACDLCDKDFRHNVGLLKHKRQVHDKEKTHMCQVCSKTFFQKYHLKIHLRSHSKEKPYECPDCGKHFSTNTIMKSHQMIHTEVKTFGCKLCGVAFKKPSYLRNHMISHTKEKRYPCAYCNIPFGRSDHRARHERTAHQRPFIRSQDNAPTQPVQ